MYWAVRDRDATEVILKLYAGDSTAQRLASAQRELETLRTLAGKGTPRPLEILLEHVTPVLVIEFVPGVALGTWIEAGLPSPSAILRVALQLAEVLGRVHAARFTHRDVNPRNVVVDPATLATHLIDFGIARRLGSAEGDAVGTGGGLAGTLLYIAPEQTGRMNRVSDMRSDLYSLGATLYHALTGRPPFESTDPLELIHAHIARVPVPPIQLRPEIPAALSEVVLKLLRKEPDERYPTAAVLHADLLMLQEQLERTGRMDGGFALGGAQEPERPSFSRKLHGREREIAKLRALQEQVCTGHASMLLIQGEPGCGKSALIDEFRPWLAEAGGYLAIGGFDLYSDRPYAGWETALGSLCQQLLVESDARLERWRTELLAGLGGIAKALVELLPDLGFILGEVEAVPALGPRETQARLSLAVQRFLGVCAGRSRPLVLFLDDLQWSDAGSRYLLEDVLSSDLPEGLLVIWACRSGVLTSGHPLTALLARLAERRIEVETLTLSTLAAEAGTEMLAEALERSVDDVHDLGRLVERKTGNNPLLIRQFIDHIHARGLLRWRRGHGWSWSPAEIAAADIPDGAVALMTEKMGRLEPISRELIELASCVGDEFDLDLLTELARLEKTSLEKALFALSDAGLIAPCTNGFRFVHGRIREAAQSMLSAETHAQLQYDIGRLLLARTPEAEHAEHASTIVDHLNRGLAHVGEDLRLTAVRLNLAAGGRALAKGAAATSEGYFGVARKLFLDRDWEQERSLGFSLLLRSAESTILVGDFDSALSLLADLERRSPSLLESAQIAARRVQIFAMTKDPVECMSYALGILSGLGVRWPLRPSPARARLALLVLRLRLRMREGRELFRPAASMDPGLLAPILVIGACTGVIGRVDLHLGVIASCWVISSNLRQGYLARPGYSLAVYAGWLQLILGDTAGAQRAAQLALEWGERVPDPVYRPRLEMHIHAILRPWWMPRRQALAGLERISESMREVGDLEYAYYARFLDSSYGALAGNPVGETGRALLEIADAVRRSGTRYPEPERFHDAYRLLLASELSDRAIENAVAESDSWLASNSGGVEAYVRTCWLLVLCVFNRHDLAFSQSERFSKWLFRIVPYVHVTDHTFYRGLAAAALASSAHRRDRVRYVHVLRRSLGKLRRWAKGGPDFAHMELLLAAEHARLRRKPERARALYEQAQQGAKRQDFIHHAALACERRARMFIDLRRETEAAAALREAGALYAKWGCETKARALEHERNALVSR